MNEIVHAAFYVISNRKGGRCRTGCRARERNRCPVRITNSYSLPALPPVAQVASSTKKSP